MKRILALLLIALLLLTLAPAALADAPVGAIVKSPAEIALTPAEKSEHLIGVPGDMDGNSTVNMKDLLLFRQNLAGGYGVAITASVADLDHNGSVNMRDLLLFRQYLAGGYGVELTPPPSGGQPLDDNSTPWIPAP